MKFYCFITFKTVQFYRFISGLSFEFFFFKSGERREEKEGDGEEGKRKKETESGLHHSGGCESEICRAGW